MKTNIITASKQYFIVVKNEPLSTTLRRGIWQRPPTNRQRLQLYNSSEGIMKSRIIEFVSPSASLVYLPAGPLAQLSADVHAVNTHLDSAW
jgi:hypothetical protein